jgi:hypothetical protein
MKKAMPPTGAHLRSMACRLILRAALRYLADSDLSDVDKVDMPMRASATSAPKYRKAARKINLQAMLRKWAPVGGIAFFMILFLYWRFF